MGWVDAYVIYINIHTYQPSEEELIWGRVLFETTEIQGNMVYAS